MFEDYSERLFAHFVAGQWRAPFGAGCVCVPMPGGRGGWPDRACRASDVARAVAVRRGADMAASLRFAAVLNAALPELTAIFELPQTAAQRLQDQPCRGLYRSWLCQHGAANLAAQIVCRGSGRGNLLPRARTIGLGYGNLWPCPKRGFAAGKLCHAACPLPQTEAALRNTGLPLHAL
jgi:hypothetical protein